MGVEQRSPSEEEIAKFKASRRTIDDEAYQKAWAENDQVIRERAMGAATVISDERPLSRFAKDTAIHQLNNEGKLTKYTDILHEKAKDIDKDKK